MTRRLREARRVLIVRQAHFRDDPRLQRQIAALADHGYQVDVICQHEAGEPRRECRGECTVHRIPIAKRRGSQVRYLAEYLGFFVAATAMVTFLHAKNRYDVIQVHNIPDALVFCAVFPRLTNTPVVLDMTEVVPELVQSKLGVPKSHPWVIAAACLERLSTRFATNVVAVSAPARAAAEARGLSAAKTITVMNAPDPALFPRTRPRRRDLASGGVRFVSHGTLVDRYGFETLVRAMPAITAALPGSRMTILGDGPSKEGLIHLVDALGLSGVVSIPGQVPLREIAARLLIEDIGIVGNQKDEFTDIVIPTKLMEYAALGIPVVASRTKAIQASFDGAVAMFDPGDANGLASAAINLAAAQDDRIRLASVPDHCVRRVGWLRSSAAYLDLYQRLTAK